MQRKQLDEEIRQFNESYELQKKQYEEGIRQFNEEIERLKNKDEKDYKLQIESLQLEKNKLRESQRQWEEEMAFQKQKYQDQLDALNNSTKSESSKDKKDTPKKKRNDDYTKSALDSKSVNALDLGPVTDDYVAELAALDGVKVDENGKVTKTENFDLAKSIVNSTAPAKDTLPTNYLTPAKLEEQTKKKTNIPKSRLGLR